MKSMIMDRLVNGNLYIEIFWLQVVVSLLALSQDGSMMCTTEVKLPEEGIGALVCLKFWASVSQNKNYCLSTIIYEPHRFDLLQIFEVEYINRS